MISTPDWIRPKEKPYKHQIPFECLGKLVDVVKIFSTASMKKSLLFPIILLVLSGCATSSSNPSFSHKSIPLERILQNQKISDNKHAATVHIMRDSSFIGSLMTTTFTIDGNEIAKIRSGEKYSFKIEPGEYIFGIKFLGNDPVLGVLTLGVARPLRWKEDAVQIRPQKEYFFRIVGNANWEWDLKRSSH